MADQEDVMKPAAPPASNGHQRRPPEQMDALGLMGGGGDEGPLVPLYRGSDEFLEWAVRGNRSSRILLAEADLMTETKGLVSPRFIIRGDVMKHVSRQDSLRTMFTAEKRELTKLEFGALVMIALFLSGMVFLVAAL